MQPPYFRIRSECHSLQKLGSVTDRGLFVCSGQTGHQRENSVPAGCPSYFKMSPLYVAMWYNVIHIDERDLAL